jgi:hypothetical protein
MRLRNLAVILVCMTGQEFIVVAIVAAWGVTTLGLMYLSRTN